MDKLVLSARHQRINPVNLQPLYNAANPENQIETFYEDADGDKSMIRLKNIDIEDGRRLVATVNGEFLDGKHEGKGFVFSYDVAALDIKLTVRN